MQPDPDVMMKFLLRLFGNQMTDGVELAWSDPVTGQISRGQMYQLDDLESLVEAASGVNRTKGVNCYIGAALRKPEGPPGRPHTGQPADRKSGYTPRSNSLAVRQGG